MIRELIIIFLASTTLLVRAKFKYPNLTLQALSPKGIRVIVDPAVSGLEVFSFHGRKNDRLFNIEDYGDFFGDVKKPDAEGRWIYENANVELEPGDTVHYWTYFRVDRLGYRKNKQEWKVTDEPGIEFVAFHGRLGKPLDIVELGDYSGEIQKPSDNAWTYENMDVQLKPGDELHYWVYVQFNRLGYRKDKQKWTVHELIPYEGKVCKPSDTTKNGKAACKGERILFDQFKSAISTSDWITEHYIPKLGPNFEFVSYRSRPENVFVRNQVLHLKPVPTTPDEQGLQILNLGDSCTSQNPEECWVKRESIVIIPPVTSGKVRSRISFKYGQIDIKARLPQGDWIYPIVQLQSTANPNASIWLAYARGNDRLTGADGDDIGSRTLFGGPVLSPTEPTRSELLRSHKLGTPYYTDVHTFGCKWEYGRIVLTVDDQQYGTIDTKNLVAFNKDEFYLTLGVGVGGINDFPEGFNSSGTPKPWINFHRRFVKTFSDAKDKWFPTWNGDQSSLQVDSVSVTAI